MKEILSPKKGLNSSKTKNAEQLFVELLQKYEVSGKLFPLIEMQLTKILENHNNSSIDQDQKLTNQLTSLQNQLKQVKIRFGMGDIDKETYDLTCQHLNEKVIEIGKELNSGKVKISNLKNSVSESLKKLSNLSKIWASNDLEGKRTLHKILFPEGIYFNAQKHEYLTPNVNKYVQLVSSLSNHYSTKNKTSLQNFIEDSCSVPGSRLELPTSGL